MFLKFHFINRKIVTFPAFPYMIPGTPNIFLIYDLNIFFNDSILKCLIAEKNPFISEKRWTVKPSANRKLESIEKKEELWELGCPLRI